MTRSCIESWVLPAPGGAAGSVVSQTERLPPMRMSTDLQKVMMGRRLLPLVQGGRQTQGRREGRRRTRRRRNQRGREGAWRTGTCVGGVLDVSADAVQTRRASCSPGERWRLRLVSTRTGWREGPDPRRKKTRKKKTTIHRRQAAERIRYECSSSTSSESAAASRAATKGEEGDNAKKPPHPICVRPDGTRRGRHARS